MPTLKPYPRRYHDEDVEDVESRASSSVSADEDFIRSTRPRWYNRSRWRFWSRRSGNDRSGLPPFDHGDAELNARRKRFCKWFTGIFAVLAILGIAAGVTYVCLVAALIRRLEPPKINSGLQHIVDIWEEPNSNGAFQFDWRDDFSRDIVPKNCHSHNDYDRSVPLYEALAAGCVSVEADIFLTDDNELLVAHSQKATKKERTLRSLYLDPLTNILTNRNTSATSSEDMDVGLFDTNTSVSVILLIDFKSDGHETWPVLLEQLQPLRDQGWLTYFNGEKLIRGPLTVVGTGNTPFDLVRENKTNRFVFFDAPLKDVLNPAYTSENSYYASVQMGSAIGQATFGLSDEQVRTLSRQIQDAAEKGLYSRYWDTPSWPISRRNKVWFALTDHGVGMLNVDDLVSATRWNWNWCIIAGLTLCGNS